jgi:gluconate 2-dehydrogenase gamma chain
VQTYGSHFNELTAEAQDFLVERFENSWLDNMRDSGRSFKRLHRLTLEGMFSDPYYGGNRNYAGWDLIAYPGAVMGSTAEMQRMGERLPPLHTSAYGAEHDGD